MLEHDNCSVCAADDIVNASYILRNDSSALNELNLTIFSEKEKADVKLKLTAKISEKRKIILKGTRKLDKDEMLVMRSMLCAMLMISSYTLKPLMTI